MTALTLNIGMGGKTAQLTDVSALVERAHVALAQAASLLKDANHDEELTYTAIRLEAETCILEVQLRRAFSASGIKGKTIGR